MCPPYASPTPMPGRFGGFGCECAGRSESGSANSGSARPKSRIWGGEWRGVSGGVSGAAIRDIGHLRWKIENNAFGELTQHWHLTHCAHPHPVAVVALLWIKIIAFTLFHAFASLHGKLFRLGKSTLTEMRMQFYRYLLCDSPIQFFSG